MARNPTAEQPARVDMPMCAWQFSSHDMTGPDSPGAAMARNPTAEQPARVDMPIISHGTASSSFSQQLIIIMKVIHGLALEIAGKHQRSRGLGVIKGSMSARCWTAYVHHPRSTGNTL
ncbi:hypothetical protein PCANC_00024 [Puccinia coronata f. sp. avenae]|uniref:Uncharacterized protein n=1 Tax=Puccinia coronata f. sp. avenae TaxID=200324 RepID=A0A2N5W8G1_9BASI|nr:hypothetical protein PCANC_00024 [Puccinia coronata f. sp. avenae]